MYSNDQEVLQHAIAWINAGRRAALITVLNTFGGSPRPPGSMAAIRDDGVVIGSVSGGCVEDDLVEEIVRGVFWKTSAQVVVRVFGADADERDRYRLPCNGTLRIGIESSPDVGILIEVLDHIRQQRSVVRSVQFSDGGAQLAAANNRPFFAETPAGFSVVLGPRYRALIIGANELGRYLARILQTLDYAVTVCDPRPEYTADRPHTNIELVRAMPSQILAMLQCDARTAILAVTHDLKLDDLTLLEALKTPAFYVGALGSQATNAKRRARLKTFNLSDAEIARLHGPIGLNIGSRTPAEIAVSIAAGLIAERRRVEQGE